MNSIPSPATLSNSKYQHFNDDERDSISILLAKGTSMRKIAEQLRRNVSSISREVARNGKQLADGALQYRAHRAIRRAQLRWQWHHQRECMSNPLVRQYVIGHLQLGWTPELIAGRIGLSIPTVSVSHETIYKYIYYNQPELIKHLAFAHKTRRKRGSAKGKRATKIPDRISIEQRPPEVDLRTREGDWEGDTIVSRASSAALAVSVERKTRRVCIKKIANKSATAFTDAVVHGLLQVPQEMRKTLTLDNGTENVDHKLITERTGVSVYFCRPYHSWEKGTVEQTNGLIRRFFPKGTDFSKISEDEISRVESLLNNRPRKCLGFLTPNEAVALAA